ncbi:MAG: formate--tetrahydrofolate ligase [Bacteroidales bacterium]|nr:formate--tetrahydrofolate ligase [Bacteroidales bacterium]MDD3521637.1 formate--tetrahydrofolate ligase [Bacteroidales bacterium]MDD4029921.1 formate--tetrahydrofolate ligase [Bacteroidales bacterium]MDD4435187.1 formate--tetrahydrofolate ligase [Bacteroidales bacterium]
MKTDIEISHQYKMLDIRDVAAKAGIACDDLSLYGNYMAKVPADRIDEDKIKDSHLILVTAITPTKAGVGKTTVSIGLSMGLNYIGKKAIVALREPSLGPCFGMKGGAAGGGYAQVVPMEDINLHFTGDFHAITAANNMISALLENHLYHNQRNGSCLREIVWKRVLDVNDRTLRAIISGVGGKTNGITRATGFDITAASEIMAILCLSKDLDDLKQRIGRIILGYSHDGSPFYVKDMGVAGAIAVLLKDAIHPNLVQTLEGTPAFVHGGPFANIAHGCNSLVATKMAMTHADYVVTEAGFGADLGAEKFFNIKCRKGGLQPKLTVLVATLQGLKMHGGQDLSKLTEKNRESVINGLANLDRHVANLRSFGQNIVVALNRYESDTEEEISLVRERCRELDVAFAVNDAYTQGARGAVALASAVVDVIEGKPSRPLIFTYPDDDTIEQKIWKVAHNIYGARNVFYYETARESMEKIRELGLGHYPVCIAKTQYSFSTDPKVYGVARDFEMNIHDLIINNGAGMIVAIAGDILRMPGLPKKPQAVFMDINDGMITGLS